jgi:TetR/AcrR family transcriptional regulator, regulator of mycofactocin system
MATPAVAAGDEPEGLWMRRRRLVASDMEQAAVHLLAERGYENVTANDLADACGISVRTFFRYFNAKRDVLLAMPRRALTNLCDAVEARPPDESLLTAWREAAVGGHYFDETDVRLAADYRMIMAAEPQLLEFVNGDPELIDRFAVTTARRLGVDADDLRALVVGSVVRGTMVAAMRRWTSSESTELVGLFGEAFDLLDDLGSIGRTSPA